MSERTSSLTLAHALAREIAPLDPASVDPAAIDKAKICLLDFLSCAFESRDLDWSRQARAIAAGRGGAHIIGTAETSTMGDAAFANAVMGHGLVREDMHPASISHHGVVVWPTLLALFAHAKVAGPRLLASAVIGYEVGCRLGRALLDKELARKFRPTGLTAPIGAAAAGAYLLDLNEERIASALAFAANFTGGLNQWPHSGGSDMYFHPGHAARGAITAILLAEQEAFGSPDIFEGEFGFFAAYANSDAGGEIAFFPGGEADILSVYSKPAPACNFAQTSCQAALRLADELPPGSSSIERIVIRVSDVAARYPGCDYSGPFHRALQAKMSIQYSTAAVLARREMSEANYGNLEDAEILRLVAATELTTSDDFSAAFPARQGTEVEVVIAGGRCLRNTQLDLVPATEAEIRARFREAAIAIVGSRRANAIEDLIDDLEKTGDVGRLARLCSERNRKQSTSAA